MTTPDKPAVPTDAEVEALIDKLETQAWDEAMAIGLSALLSARRAEAQKAEKLRQLGEKALELLSPLPRGYANAQAAVAGQRLSLLRQHARSLGLLAPEPREGGG